MAAATAALTAPSAAAVGEGQFSEGGAGGVMVRKVLPEGVRDAVEAHVWMGVSPLDIPFVMWHQ